MQGVSCCTRLPLFSPAQVSIHESEGSGGRREEEEGREGEEIGMKREGEGRKEGEGERKYKGEEEKDETERIGREGWDTPVSGKSW